MTNKDQDGEMCALRDELLTILDWLATAPWINGPISTITDRVAREQGHPLGDDRGAATRWEKLEHRPPRTAEGAARQT